MKHSDTDFRYWSEKAMLEEAAAINANELTESNTHRRLSIIYSTKAMIALMRSGD